jgi:hypothetical protein
MTREKSGLRDRLVEATWDNTINRVSRYHPSHYIDGIVRGRTESEVDNLRIGISEMVLV